MRRLTRDEWIARFREAHKDQFDYSQLPEDMQARGKYPVGCKVHGFWEIEAHAHGRGIGCKKCADIKRGIGKRRSWKERVEQFRKVHGGRYTYPETKDWVPSHATMEVVCPDHGSFWPSPSNHLNGTGCPSCAKNLTSSLLERSLYDRISGYSLVLSQQKIGAYVADIVIPSRNLVIEFNGARWHSERYLPSDHHKKRSEEFARHGYRTTHIWDFEMDNAPLLALIDSAAGKPQTLLNARGCAVKQITWKEAKDFFQANHPQGAPVARATHIHALYHEDQIVAAMAFQQGHVRRGGAALADWELVRFASLAGHRVRGAASRLFRYRPEGSISSLSDNRLFTGGMYEVLGFEKQRVYGPDYFYIGKGDLVIRKQSAQKKAIRQMFDLPDDGRTEKEMMNAKGFYRVYDCGKTLWLYMPESIC